jgi:hypothetical protein
MGELYSSSFCNLAATASSNGRGGLFRDRNSGSVLPCIVHATWNGLQKGYFFCFNPEEWKYEVTQAPLNCRGWVLQERLLSPRVLHFGASQLYWECEELSASEAYPQGLPRSMKGYGIKEALSLRKSASPSQMNGDSTNCYSVWKFCVNEYSKCALTIESDKLVALSGIARLMHENLGSEDTYLAGLWKSRLTWHLLWEIHTPWRGGEGGRRSKLYRAPSWSWACLDGEILFPDPSVGTAEINTDMATILDVDVIPLGDSFGQVVSGTVRIRGPLFRVKLQQRFTRGGTRRIGYDMILCGRTLRTYDPLIRADEDVLLSTNLDHDFHCLAVRSYYNSGKHWVRGLILEPTGNVKGQFQRVGIFTECESELYIDLIAKNLLFDPDLVYEENNGDGNFTVSIV